MRLNYERCLLDFENYLGSGQYAADLAAGTAPHFTSVTEPQRNFGHLPPPDMGLEGDAGGVAAHTVRCNSLMVMAKSVRDEPGSSPAPGSLWSYWFKSGSMVSVPTPWPPPEVVHAAGLCMQTSTGTAQTLDSSEHSISHLLRDMLRVSSLVLPTCRHLSTLCSYPD
jgi:hypothetical protein